jgi:hypothetical protein
MTTDEPLDEAAAERAEAMAEREAAALAGTASAAHDAAAQDQTPNPADLSITFTPRQILGGFALLAGLVMLLRRKRRDPDRGEPD